MSSQRLEGPEPISDEELAELESRLGDIGCAGEREWIDRTDMWSCSECNTVGKIAHGFWHQNPQTQEDLARLFQIVRDLKQELPMAIEHALRIGYGPPYDSTDESEFHFRQGWDAACAFMASELAEKWHLYDETIENKEKRNGNSD
jgi:hypothetical protein